MNTKTLKMSTLNTNTLRAVLLLLAIQFFLTGCAVNYLVDKRDITETFRESRDNVLSTGELSAETGQELRILGLEDSFKDDPEKGLAVMEANRIQGREAEQALALAESAYYYAYKLYKRGQRVESAGYFLMAAAHSYDFLFYSKDQLSRSFVSPFGRFGTELYNASVSKIIDIRETENTPWSLPWKAEVGNTVYQFSREQDLSKQIEPGSFEEYIPAYEIKARSLKNLYSSYGIGAPFVGKRKNGPDSPGYDPFFPPVVSAPATILFKFSPHPTTSPAFGSSASSSEAKATQATPQETVEAQNLDHKQPEKIVRDVTVAVLDPFRLDAVTINGSEYPIEADYSASFGVLLRDVRPGQFVLDALLNAGNHVSRTKLTFLQPYDPNKIPVVLVHGLYSSPATYIQMLNDLMGVEAVRRKYQFWVFGYPTGLPIIENSTRLRAALRETAKKFDPTGTSKTFNQMVVVGHSMGGIITRTMVVENSKKIWDSFFTVPIEQLNLTEDERNYVREIGSFEALPFISRVVLIAAPLRGSDIAQGSIISRISRWLISLPEAMAQRRLSLLSKNKEFLNPALRNDEFIGVAKSSVDNLRSDSPVLAAYINTPIKSGVAYHSIIGIEDATTGPGSDDGLVKYESAHLDGAESELLVNWGHVCLERPETIAEVRRILLLHLAKLPNDNQRISLAKEN